MNRILHDKRFVAATVFLVTLVLIGIFADYIATTDGIIPYGPNDMNDTGAIYSPPGTSDLMDDGSEAIHYFGTDHIGRDVASRLVHGISIAFKVGIWSSILSLLIALFLGSLAGFVGDHSQRINVFQIIWLSFGFILLHHLSSEFAFSEDDRGIYNFHIARYALVFGAGLPVILLVNKLVAKRKVRTFLIPYDTLVIKLIEVFRSVPRLFLLLAIFAVISRPSVISVIIVIGIIRWPTLTRIIRAEIIKIKQEDYINSAKLLGLGGINVFIFHILPNIYKPIIVLTSLNMGSAILIESSLSFLQIGLPLEEVSWGRMLSDARDYISAWWLGVGPGFLIFAIILAFKVIGDRLSYHFNIDHSSI